MRLRDNHSDSKEIAMFNEKTEGFSDKTELYEALTLSLEAQLRGEGEWLPNLCNASALLWSYQKDINWAGFYVVCGDYLLLGPFQGKPACVTIGHGNGVCGAAWAQEAVQRVPDVHQFPGHIACDGASNSEIVLPIFSQGRVVAVLDIDSPLFDRFDEADEAGLKQVVALLERHVDWQRVQGAYDPAGNAARKMVCTVGF